jgi:hypothetical protein
MKINRFLTLVAVLTSCLAFTISCSDDTDNKSGSGVCLSQGVLCTEGLTEEMCKMHQSVGQEYEWKEGSCPSDWTRCPAEGGIVNYLNPDIYSTCPEY